MTSEGLVGCQVCSKHFHKFKCFPTPAHPCYSRTRAKSCNTAPTPVETIRTTQPVLLSLSSGAPQSFHSDGTFPPPLLATSAAHLTIQEQTHPRDEIVPINHSEPDLNHEHPVLAIPPTTAITNTQRNSPPAVTSLLNPGAPAFTSSQDITEPDHPQPTQSNPKQTGTRKKTKLVPATDPQGIEYEYNKYALKTAKTKICEQETEINDLKFRNKILEDRIASLEKRQKKEIHDEYYSPAPDPQRHSCCRYRNQCCNQAPPIHCCSSAPSSSGVGQANEKLSKASADIEQHGKLIVEINKKVDELSILLMSQANQPQQTPTTTPLSQQSPSSASHLPSVSPPAPSQQTATGLVSSPLTKATSHSPENKDPSVQNTSAMSIDLAMNDLTSPNQYLNSQLPTTQFPQLEQCTALPSYL